MTAMFGSLLAYVSTVPQVFVGAFHAPQLMAVTFAICAGAMGAATFVNSRIVERVGMHRIAHAALVAFIIVTALHAGIARQGTESLVTFALLQSATMACFGLAVSNFGAIAMQPMGAIAGSAASIQGVISTIGGALVGSLIGHQWSGSVFFLPAGAFCCGVAALTCVLFAEKARLFRYRAHPHS
jgi:DHA1 family bicyclomycin/chloramphenicol resistance-like MFS transporter